MKFSANRMYVESYEKCQNCGILLYESAADKQDRQAIDGRIYCSAWCVDWAAERMARRLAPG
ncbi:hypothetical protein [Aureimonas sp. AU12]|uniref:hypothetical protein n=1 Tax=Aureimonas sp. AU12 TaxID=1638161 RepID=UPI00078209A4|nr:hypothetical protein [Aureimonas sp. AU12]